MPVESPTPIPETESGLPTAAECRRHPCPACQQEVEAAYRALWHKSRDWEAYTGMLVGAFIAAALFLPLLLMEKEQMNWGWYVLTPPLSIAAGITLILGWRHSDRLEKAAKAVRRAAAANRQGQAS